MPHLVTSRICKKQALTHVGIEPNENVHAVRGLNSRYFEEMCLALLGLCGSFSMFNSGLQLTSFSGDWSNVRESKIWLIVGSVALCLVNLVKLRQVFTEGETMYMRGVSLLYLLAGALLLIGAVIGIDNFNGAALIVSSMVALTISSVCSLVYVHPSFSTRCNPRRIQGIHSLACTLDFVGAFTFGDGAALFLVSGPGMEPSLYGYGSKKITAAAALFFLGSLAALWHLYDLMSYEVVIAGLRGDQSASSGIKIFADDAEAIEDCESDAVEDSQILHSTGRMPAQVLNLKAQLLVKPMKAIKKTYQHDYTTVLVYCFLSEPFSFSQYMPTMSNRVQFFLSSVPPST